MIIVLVLTSLKMFLISPLYVQLPICTIILMETDGQKIVFSELDPILFNLPQTEGNFFSHF